MKNGFKILLLVVYFIFLESHTLIGQVGCDIEGNYCLFNGTVAICSGWIIDAGGGSTYPNADYTLTICPGTEDNVTQLFFAGFNLQTNINPQNSDYLRIYDGVNTSAPLLGSYTGTSLQQITIIATASNISGCLTLSFTDNGSANTMYPGFQCQVTCVSPMSNICETEGHYCMEDVTLSLCSGILSDSGGNQPYLPQENTMTICPESLEDVTRLSFVDFDLQTSINPTNSDFLTIYDGENTSAPIIGIFGDNDLMGINIAATSNNSTGCLTLAFEDNGNPNASFEGFTCEISCAAACSPPFAVSTIVYPVSEDIEFPSVNVCANQVVTFGDNGSYAQLGYTLGSFIWDFDDGTVITNNGENIDHSFSEPGEYEVKLFVLDSNGCQSHNVSSTQVIVSTIPSFAGIESLNTCFGEQVILNGYYESTSWFSFDPQVFEVESILPDGAGFYYPSSVFIDSFSEGEVLEDCSDFSSVLVNLEHSYMGDLGISITCPDGTEVSLVQWGMNGGGGTDLGEPGDNGSSLPGIGWDYSWSPTATNGVWGQNTQLDFLPSGTYEASGELCDLVGCPLNGIWTMTITDNLSFDDGYFFYWGIDFNPFLYPEISSFTPSIGMGADSSYWTGPFIVDSDFYADEITILPDQAGSYNYTYSTINSFGCQFDTTINVSFVQAPLVSAGLDQDYSCGEVELEGSFIGLDLPSCESDAGIFNYCYGDSENFTWTFCPDIPNDGVSYMSFRFISGQMEFLVESFTVYDGDNTAAPVIATWNMGDASGQMWTATNETGCITVTFTSDASISCGGGFFNEWTYEVICANGNPDYYWEWSPGENLDNPNTPNPILQNLEQSTIFTLVGYPVGHPDCASSDQVLVEVIELPNSGEDSVVTICSTASELNLIEYLAGSPDTGGVWTAPDGDTLSNGILNPSFNLSGAYIYHLDFLECTFQSQVFVNIINSTEFDLLIDSVICVGAEANLSLTNLNYGSPPYNYEWSYEGALIGSTAEITYAIPYSGEICLTITDDCEHITTKCALVTVGSNPGGENCLGCESDFDGNGFIGTSDLIVLLGSLGCNQNCTTGDLSGDNIVGTTDVLMFLSLFGTVCP